MQRRYPRTLASNYQRAIRLEFRHRTDAARDDQRDGLWLRSEGGRWPTVLVPDDSKPEVLYCRTLETYEAKRTFLTIHESDMAFEEEPFPVVIS